MLRQNKCATSSLSGDGGEVMDEYGASKYIGVCGKTLRKLRKEAKIPFARVGGRVVYLRPQLYAWLAAGGTKAQEVER